MPTFKPEQLSRAIAATFEACDTPPDSARIVADHLVDAQMCGVGSHGLIRVPQYVGLIESGAIKPNARAETVSERAAAAVINGNDGFGQVMARHAMDVCIGKALEAGTAGVTLCNCSHTGRLAAYTMQAAERGLVAMMMVNAGGCGQWVAPFGGSAGRLATNPVSFAVPSGVGFPIALDYATSAAPEGKIRAMKTSGQPIPEGWLVDASGRPTTDPESLYETPRGALLPFGGNEGYKGFALSLVVEAMAGGLSGAGCCNDPNAPMGGKTDGVFMFACAIDAFMDRDTFDREVTSMLQHVRSSPPAQGFERVIIPGELEHDHRARCEQEGITIDDGTWATVEDSMSRLGISVEAQ